MIRTLQKVKLYRAGSWDVDAIELDALDQAIAQVSAEGRQTDLAYLCAGCGPIDVVAPDGTCPYCGASSEDIAQRILPKQIGSVSAESAERADSTGRSAAPSSSPSAGRLPTVDQEFGGGVAPEPTGNNGVRATVAGLTDPTTNSAGRLPTTPEPCGRCGGTGAIFDTDGEEHNCYDCEGTREAPASPSSLSVEQAAAKVERDIQPLLVAIYTAGVRQELTSHTIEQAIDAIVTRIIAVQSDRDLRRDSALLEAQGRAALLEKEPVEAIYAAVYALAERCCLEGTLGANEFWQTFPEWSRVIESVEARPVSGGSDGSPNRDVASVIYRAPNPIDARKEGEVAAPPQASDPPRWCTCNRKPWQHHSETCALRVKGTDA